jgi:hypothetical protein
MSERLNYGSIDTIDPLLTQIGEIQRMLAKLRSNS